MSNSCNICGEEIKSAWDECPSCGAKIERTPRCRNCGAEIKLTWIKCPECKTSTGVVTPGSATVPGSVSKPDNDPFVSRPSGGTTKVWQEAPGTPVSLAPHADGPTEAPEFCEGDVLSGQFEIRKKIGQGGYGGVYLARDILAKEDVAIKAVGTFGRSEEVIQAFVAEYSAQKRILDRRHIVHADRPQAFTHAGMDWVLLPMEPAEKSLRQWFLETSGDLAGRLEAGLEFVRQACRGVAAIHEAGLIHLDLKPENILLFRPEGLKVGSTDQPWLVKIADFGLARGLAKLAELRPELLADGIGTPAYMAPEQVLAARWKDVGKAADIYGLGMILYELIDGDLPYSGTAEAIRSKKINPQMRISVPDGPPVLVQLTMTCLDRDPSARPIDSLLLERSLKNGRPALISGKQPSTKQTVEHETKSATDEKKPSDQNVENKKTAPRPNKEPKKSTLSKLLYGAADKGDLSAVDRILNEIKSQSEEVVGLGDSLWVAIENNHAAIVNKLIKAGANVNSEKHICHAVQKGSKEVVELLVNGGADIETRDDNYDITPLGLALLDMNSAVAEFLISKGADINASFRDRGSPLIMAIKNGAKRIFEILLEKGADLEVPDCYGDPPLHIAMRSNRPDLAKILILKGADVNSPDGSGESPLSVAESENYIEIMKLLKKRGASE